ncbi:MAG: hypothetical protein WCT46_02025 [Candidatus Gracilibacteria bacterium]
MSNICTPCSKELLTKKALGYASSSLDDENLRRNVLEAITRILNRLPAIILTYRQLTTQCFTQTEIETENIRVAFPDHKKIIDHTREEICCELRCVLYADYIQAFLLKLIAYMKTNNPEKHWGLGSIAKINEIQGNTFYYQWKNYIAFNDPEREFEERILKKLPEKWQRMYKPKNFCEYKWGDMTDEDIAKVLSNLEKKGKPEEKWGFGSINHWTKNGQAIGKSFYNKWIKITAGKDHVEEFKNRILPHMPEELKRTFNHTEQVQWAKMGDEELAAILTGLKKDMDPAMHLWGVGSIKTWCLEDGKPLGRGFIISGEDSVMTKQQK